MPKVYIDVDFDLRTKTLKNLSSKEKDKAWHKAKIKALKNAIKFLNKKVIYEKSI